LKLLVRLILLTLALLAVFTALLPFSEVGSRLLAELARRLPGLEIEYRGGSIVSGLELASLSYTSGGLNFELREVSTRLEPGCLWRSALCFSDLHVDALVVELAGENPQETAPAATAVDDRRGPFVFPVALVSDDLRIASTRILWDGGEWRQGPARFDVRAQGSQLVIAEAELASTSLVLVEHASDDEPPPGPVQLPGISLPFELAVDSLRLLDTHWEIYGTVARVDSLSLAGLWRGSELALERLQATSGEQGSLDLEGTVDFSGDWPLRAGVRLEVVDEQLWADLRDRPIDIELFGPLSALSAGVSHEGDQAIQLDVEVNLLDRQLPFNLELEIAGTQPLLLSELPGVNAQLADLALVFPWRASARGSLEKQLFQLRGDLSGLGYDALSLALAGEFAGKELRVSDLSLEDGTGENRLQGEGQASFGAELALSMELKTPGFTLPLVPSLPNGRLEGALALAARLGEGTWQVGVTEIAVQGEINELPARVSGDFFLDQDWALRETDLQGVVNGAKVNLLAAADASREGRVEVSIDDLGRWQPGARGRLELQGRVSAGAQTLEVQGQMENLRWGTLATDHVRLSGKYTRQSDAFDLSLQAEPLVAGQVDLSELEATVSGDMRRQTLNVLSRGDIEGQLSLSGTGWTDGWRGELAPATLVTPHGTWQLEQLVALEWQPEAGQLVVAAHCWERAAGAVCARELGLGRSGRVALEASGDLSELGSLLPASMAINGSAEVTLTGSWDEGGGVSFEGRSATRSVVLTRHYGEGESASVRWDRGDGRLRYDGADIALQWSLQRDGRGLLDADVLLPTDPEKPLAGRFSVDRLRLESLIAFLPALSQLEGEVTGQLDLAGTRDKPLATGELRLEGAKLALIGNPTRVESLQVSMRFLGERATLAGAGLLGGGEVRLDGELSLQPEWRLQLQVAGEQQNVLYPPATELRLSERLTVIASAGLLQVSGDITVHEGSLEPEELPEGSVAVSPDVVEVDYAGNVISADLPFDIDLNVRIVVEDRFRVRTSVLLATLGGELQLKQLRGQPLQVYGTLRVIDGRVSAYQQSLQIQRGTFSFTGRPDNPAVNVRAVRKISGSNVVVGIQVQGTYDSLTMEVFSEPRMSDGEAMSYLVRGRAPDASAGEDGTALALSVASGVVNRTTLVSELNRIPGVSNVSFGAEGSNEDTAATVSGFIGDRIYLSYGVGVYEPINVLVARLYLRTRLWLEVVSRLENSIDLYYAFDID
jgi:autotransporter translocation and assembly factor TamB